MATTWHFAYATPGHVENFINDNIFTVHRHVWDLGKMSFYLYRFVLLIQITPGTVYVHHNQVCSV